MRLSIDDESLALDLIAVYIALETHGAPPKSTISHDEYKHTFYELMNRASRSTSIRPTTHLVP